MLYIVNCNWKTLFQAVTFYKSKNLIVRNLNIQDAQQIHVSFDKCTNVEASSLTVKAPEKSPNTDGIHITHTQNIQITNSVIGTGTLYHDFINQILPL